jgi:hypothetical protein
MLPVVQPEQNEEKSRLPWDFRDSIPHLLIKTIGAKVQKPEDIISLMSKPIPVSEKKMVKSLPTNYAEYKVRFTFSNIKRYFNDANGTFMHPNTRLEFLNTKLCIPQNNNFSFYTIDKLENEFEEIDLGSLERNKSVTFNAKLTGTGQLGSSVESINTNSSANTNNSKSSDEQPVYDNKGNIVGKINSSGELINLKNNSNTTNTKTGANLTATGEVGYLDAESIKEAIAVKLRRMKTGFSFSASEIVISQRGRPNGEISDNIYVTATLKFMVNNNVPDLTVYTFDNLFDENYQSTPADKLTFSKRTVKYVKCGGAQPINLNTEYEGALRVVGNTIKQPGVNALENDDQVTYYKIPQKEGPVLAINPSLYCKEVYKITAKNKAGESFDLRILWNSEDELDLFSDDKPEQFMQWLLKQKANPDKKKLSSNKFELFFEGPRATKIYIVKSNMSDADITAIGTLNGITTEARNQ